MRSKDAGSDASDVRIFVVATFAAAVSLGGPAPSAPTASGSPPLRLGSIGITLGDYDPTTGRMGDLVLTSGPLALGRVFMDYGFLISETDSGRPKRNPQPTFIAPMGTKVRALVTGVVVSIPKLYSGDYSVMVAKDRTSQFLYETEHVTNVRVKVGQRVKAGQIVAEVSPHSSSSNGGLGLFEIGILSGGTPPKHLCPFAYLDTKIRASVQRHLRSLYREFEQIRGDRSLYDEGRFPMPGCETTAAING